MNKAKKKNSIIMMALKLFTKQGFYTTKISDISKSMDMSVGGIYDYFPSKKSLARASIKMVTQKLASELRYINQMDISQKDKIAQFVEIYFSFIEDSPEMIEYFFRVYLSNRELFCDEDDCGFSLAKEFIDEVEKLIDDGVKTGEFKEQNFFVSFSLICGILGAFTFLNGENVLEKDMSVYQDGIVNNIYDALSVRAS